MIYWNGESADFQSNAFELFSHTLFYFTRMDQGWYFESFPKSSEPIVNSHMPRPTGPTQEHTIQTIHHISKRGKDIELALARQIQNRSMLKRTEKTIKIMLLCLTLRYLEAINSAKKQKISLSNESNHTIESHERLKMKKEEERAKERDKFRWIVNCRARKGNYRIAKRKVHELSTNVSFDIHLHQLINEREICSKSNIFFLRFSNRLKS